MKILRLRAKNFIGFKKGLGLDVVDVDLQNVNGLVAISGENGAGKSTFIELLAPYAQMVSRKGAIQSHTFGRDAEKLLEFEFQGDHYKTLLKIDSEASKTEGYVWKNQKPMIDGKISNYKKYIAELMGSPELFFNSIFCAQGSDKFSDMKTGELKRLFSEFLRLDRLVAYEETAKQCCNLRTGQTARLGIEITSLSNLAAGQKEADADRLASQLAGKTLDSLLTELSDNLSEMEIEAIKLQGELQENEVLRTELSGLRSAKTLLVAEIEADQKQSKAELDVLRAKYQTLALDLLGLDSLLSNKKEILNAVVSVERLTPAVSKGSSQLARLSEKHAATTQAVLASERLISERRLIHKNAIDKAENDKDRRIAKTENDIMQRLTFREVEQNRLIAAYNIEVGHAKHNQEIVVAKLESAKLSAKDLDTRDTVLLEAGESECASTACPFISTALSAKETIPNIVLAIDYQTTEVAKIKKAHLDTLKPIDAQIKALREDKTASEQNIILSAEIHRLKQKYGVTLAADSAEMDKLTFENRIAKADKEKAGIVFASLETDLESARTLAKEAPKVETALSRKQDAEKLQAANTEDGKRIKASWGERIAEKEKRLADAELTILEKEALVKPEADESLPVIEQSIKDLKTAITTQADAITEHASKLVLLEAEVNKKERAQKELEEKKLDSERLVNEASEWFYIQIGCSAKGLRALEIDAVAPLITGYANDLLVGTFGPNAMVTLRTQNDEGREILDIQVVDENGDIVVLGNRSGGQQVWALKAIRLAMALISKEKSGRDFRTILSDEETGPLDDENAQKYILLYRAFMEQGGFDTSFYITHNPNCVALADHVVDFTAAAVTVS